MVVVRNTSIVMGESNRFLKGAFLVICFWGTLITVHAQGSLSEDPGVSRMLQEYANRHKSRSTVKAWRIQVAASSNRRRIESEKERFENIYPYYRLELVHDNPYYIIKIRDIAYREKIDALHLLHQIKRRYPSAILVLDDVKPQLLLTSEK